MMRKFKELETKLANGEIVVVPAVVAGALVAIASLLVGSDRGDVRVDVAMASMAAFLFGVLLAFTIVRTRERLSLIQDLVAKGNSSLFAIHEAVAVFGEADKEHIRELVDLHLTDQIDYRLVDYYRATPSHLELIEAVIALDPEDAQEEAVYKELVGLCINMNLDRALIESATGQALSTIEWGGLLLLLLVFAGLLAILPGGTIPGALVCGALAGSLVTFMVLLRKLDRLRWHERVSIWEPTARLFRSMGLDPYVPREVIESGRFRPTGRVRVVEYPDPYPIRDTKIVKVEVLGPLPGDSAPDLHSRSGYTL
jgi:hypothetical protein